MKIKYFSENTQGCDYLVGDIHGVFEKLQAELDNMGFDPVVDRLFVVGGLVDRGPSSELALDYLDKPWFHSVKGNHEQMAIDWVDDIGMDKYTYEYNGGRWMTDMQPTRARVYAQAFAELPLVIGVERHGKKYGILHGDVPVNDWNDLEEALEGVAGEWRANSILWGRERYTHRHNLPVANVELVYVGHTPLKNTMTLGNVVYLDTGACFSGKLTIVKLGDEC